MQRSLLMFEWSDPTQCLNWSTEIRSSIFAILDRPSEVLIIIANKVQNEFKWHLLETGRLAGSHENGEYEGDLPEL